MIPKTVCAMLLSSLLVGCSSFSSNKEVWPLPQKPNLMTIQFVPMPDIGINTNGYYLSEVNAQNLLTNIQEMKYYELKLQLLLDNLRSVYNLKWEVYKPSEK